MAGVELENCHGVELENYHGVELENYHGAELEKYHGVRSSNVGNVNAQLKRRKTRNPLTESGMGELGCLLSEESGNTWTCACAWHF